MRKPSNPVPVICTYAPFEMIPGGGVGALCESRVALGEATGAGTGFKFWEPSPTAIYYTVGWAISTYYDRPHHIQKMIHSAMAQDYSWGRSTIQYLNLYNKAIANKSSF